MIHSPLKYSERIDSFLRFPLLKSWIKKYQPHPYFRWRSELYEHVSRSIGNDVPISYLEFGVYKGETLLNWIRLNSNPRSEFFGFDSFLGLPEDWVNLRNIRKTGTFSTEGQEPKIEDGRVKFVKGWFQDTLPSFLDGFSSEKQLVIHCDADLYSSTMYVLCKMDTCIGPGTVLIFDEFATMLHEFRALDDYSTSFRRKYEVLAAAGHKYYDKIAIRFLE